MAAEIPLWNTILDDTLLVENDVLVRHLDAVKRKN